MWGQQQGQVGWAGAPAAASGGGFGFGGGAAVAPSSGAFAVAPLGMPASSAATFPAFGANPLAPAFGNPLAPAPAAGGMFMASTGGAASSSTAFPAASSGGLPGFGALSGGFGAPFAGFGTTGGLGLGAGGPFGSATVASAGGGTTAPAAQAAKTQGTSLAHAPRVVPRIMSSLRFAVDTEKKPKVPAAARALAPRDVPHNFCSAIGC